MDKSGTFHVRVVNGTQVDNYTAEETNISAVKRQTTRMKADSVEITDSEGVVWVRDITDTRWRKTVPSRPNPTTMEEIMARMMVSASEHRELAVRLDAFREKCPTCMCRLLPKETCRCCVAREGIKKILTTVEDKLRSGNDTPQTSPKFNLKPKPDHNLN